MATDKVKRDVWYLPGPFSQYAGGAEAVKDLARSNGLRIVDARYASPEEQAYDGCEKPPEVVTAVAAAEKAALDAAAAKAAADEAADKAAKVKK